MKPIQLIKLSVAAAASGLVLAGCITAKPMVVATPVAATPAAAVVGDADQDGVADDRDACPGTPAGVQVDDKGCEIILRLNVAHFRFDSSKLTDADKAELDSAAAKMKESPAKSFEIAGHTDWTGTDAYNMGLGERRAKAVFDYLAAVGVPADKMEVISYGETKPIASNETKAGRAQNRRVEVVDLGAK